MRPHHAARLTPEGPELWCFACKTWWAFDRTSWSPGNLARCRACVAESTRRKNMTPAARAARKRYWLAHRDEMRAYSTQYARLRRAGLRALAQKLESDAA